MPKTSQAMVGTLVRTIFEQPDAEQVWAQHARVVDQLASRFTEVAEMLTDMAPDLLAFTSFPTEHWSAIRSNNPQERLNKELRRRTDVVGIFPIAPRSSDWSVRCWPSSTTNLEGNTARG